MPARSADHLRLGRAIRNRRVALGLSQAQLAAASGLHRTYLGGIERGERNPSYANLLRVAAALDLSAADLLRQAEGR